MDVERLPIDTRDVPVAKPARASLRVKTKPQDVDPDDSPIDWFSYDTYRGWPTSLFAHALFLVAMGFWVFAPKPKPVKFDSRLMGSEMGVEDGLTATGGLNTELEMAAGAEAPEPEPVITSLNPVDLAALEASLPKPAKSAKASAAGGMNNPNPGAGIGDGFGLAKFGEGGEMIRGVEVKVGDPQFTLIWDTNVDLDLHVVEPGGKEIYTFERKSKRGGELDTDNMKGFGPENVYWMHEDEATGERSKGQGPAGEYKWFVVYWGGFDGAPKVTHWKVRIKHDGKVTVVTGRLRTLNEQSRVYTLKVGS